MQCATSLSISIFISCSQHMTIMAVYEVTYIDSGHQGYIALLTGYTVRSSI